MSDSPLGSLREAREETIAAQVMDYQLPRWPVDLHLRFNILQGPEMDAGRNQLRKVKPQDRVKVALGINADMLVKACCGIYAVVDGIKYENTGINEWTPIEDQKLTKWEPDGILTPELAATLGLDGASTARAVMVALFIADGDLVTCSAKLGEFSGWAGQEADDDFL